MHIRNMFYSVAFQRARRFCSFVFNTQNKITQIVLG